MHDGQKAKHGGTAVQASDGPGANKLLVVHGCSTYDEQVRQRAWWGGGVGLTYWLTQAWLRNPTFSGLEGMQHASAGETGTLRAPAMS